VPAQRQRQPAQAVQQVEVQVALTWTQRVLALPPPAAMRFEADSRRMHAEGFWTFACASCNALSIFSELRAYCD
jgi:hypothetical protein